MIFVERCRAWLLAHPLKPPAEHDAACYTIEVMQRVRALHQPATRPAAILHWLSWPQLSFAAAVATMAVVLVTMVSLRHRTFQLARAVVQDARVIEALDESPLEPSTQEQDPELLAREAAFVDALQLAEVQPGASSSDEQWLEETVQLLEQLDEDVPPDSSGSAS